MPRSLVPCSALHPFKYHLGASAHLNYFSKLLLSRHFQSFKPLLIVLVASQVIALLHICQIEIMYVKPLDQWGQWLVNQI